MISVLWALSGLWILESWGSGSSLKGVLEFRVFEVQGGLEFRVFGFRGCP